MYPFTPFFPSPLHAALFFLCFNLSCNPQNFTFWLFLFVCLFGFFRTKRSDSSLLDRDVVKIITPGTLIEPLHTEANYLLSIATSSSSTVGLAWADISTAEIKVPNDIPLFCVFAQSDTERFPRGGPGYGGFHLEVLVREVSTWRSWLGRFPCGGPG